MDIYLKHFKNMTKRVINKSDREKDPMFIEYKDLYERIIKCLPNDKKRYWLGRLKGIKTFKSKIEFLKNMVKYWEKKGEKESDKIITNTKFSIT